MKRFYPLLILIAIGFFFVPFIFKGLLPIPSDALVGLYHPFRDHFASVFPRGVPFKNFLITDPVRQQFPWRYLVVEGLKNFQLPLWNPYNGLGEPLLANSQSGVFSPLNILFFIFPFGYAWGLGILGQMVLGGLGFYLYAQNLKLQKIASLFGAVTFIFSGFFIVWLEWGTLSLSLAFLPLILLSIDKVVTRANWRWFLFFVTSLSFSFFAGHQQIFLYVLLCSICYSIFRLKSLKNKKRSLFLLCGGYVFTVIISSIIWIPLLQLILLSSRTSDIAWQHTVGWFIPPIQFIQFIAPDFFGNPATLNYFGVWNYAEMIGFAGLVGLYFVLFAFISEKKKETYFFGIAALVALLFAVDSPISHIPYMLKLAFFSISQPTRLLSIVDFSLSILAAIGLSQFLQTKKRMFLPLLAIGIAFCGLWIFVRLHSGSQIDISRRNLILPTVTFLVLSVIISVIAFIHMKKNVSKIVFLLTTLIVLVGFFDQLRFAQKFTPFTSQKYLFPNTRSITFLQNQTNTYPWRVMSVDLLSGGKEILPPNVNAYYHLQMPDSYNSFLLKNYQDFIATSEFGATEFNTISFNRIVSPNNYSSRLVDFMGVKYIASLIPISDPTLQLVFQEGDTKIYENTQVTPRSFMIYHAIVASSSSQTAKLLLDKSINLSQTAILDKSLPFNPIGNALWQVNILSYQSNSVTLKVTTESTGLLVLTDTYYPTWHAYVDNKEEEIIPVDGVFRGVIVSKGTHTVEFKDRLF